MEVDMEMEGDMEAVFVFEAREVDIDYEFDAAMFFDFTREESLMEALEAERWFEIAPNYPPSPFVAKLGLREEMLLEDPISKDTEHGATLLRDGHCHAPGLGVPSVESQGCNNMYRGVFTNLRGGDSPKVPNARPILAAVVKKPTKSNIFRSSTLMKPTASILAKRSCGPQSYGSRFQMLLAQKEKTLCNPSAEVQATKRQKLEGGLSCKVGDAKQQTDFAHKEPKKDGSRLRITIPREPDLETASRAQRMRPIDSKEVKDVPMVPRRFKARPLNRKILEAPSLPLPKKSTPKLPEFHEFHLKTLERATQHKTTVSSSSHEHHNVKQGLDKPSIPSVSINTKREFRRPSAMNAEKLDSSSSMHVFKARPLNRKILTGRGDLGSFRNSEREATVPTEFNFHGEKRMQYNLPIDLFSKLSLTSELQTNNGSQLRLPQPRSLSIKGSKENRLNTLQTEHKMKESTRETPSIYGGKHTHCIDAGNQLRVRKLGIR